MEAEMSVRGRRHFVTAGVGSLVAMAMRPGRAAVVAQEGPPALPGDQVSEFVRVAHADLGRMTTMLDDEPALLNATWDWGAGDFETVLGAASHMGHRDIAALLLGRGARLDHFCAAMMGMLDVVRPVVDAYADAIDWLGPHRIPLLRHAVAGEAHDVADFLRSKGAV
jgi:hypothetical protein